MHIATFASYYKIVNLLVENGADLFVRNGKNLTAHNCITNNLLMIKILKKAEINQMQHLNPTHEKSKPHENHLINKQMLSKSIVRFITRDKATQLIKMQSFADSLRLLTQSLKFPFQINRSQTPNLFALPPPEPAKQNNGLLPDTPNSLKDEVQKKRGIMSPRVNAKEVFGKKIIKYNDQAANSRNPMNPSLQKQQFITTTNQMNKRKKFDKIKDSEKYSKYRSLTKQNNIFFMKEEILSSQFPLLESQEQINKWSIFRQLYMPNDIKHANALNQILLKIHETNVEYLVEEVFDLLELTIMTTNKSVQNIIKSSLLKLSTLLPFNALDDHIRIREILKLLDRRPMKITQAEDNLRTSLTNAKDFMIHMNKHTSKNPFNQASFSPGSFNNSGPDFYRSLQTTPTANNAVTRVGQTSFTQQKENHEFNRISLNNRMTEFVY